MPFGTDDSYSIDLWYQMNTCRVKISARARSPAWKLTPSVTLTLWSLVYKATLTEESRQMVLP